MAFLCNKSTILYIHENCLQMHDLFRAMNQLFYISTKKVCKWKTYFVEQINNMIYPPEPSANALLTLFDE